MSYNEFMANANTAFGCGQFDQVLVYIEKALSENGLNNNQRKVAYSLAGKTYLSLDKPAEAEVQFRKAVAAAPTEGNNYFLLGYAQSMTDNSVGALQSFTQALENGCDYMLKGQIYKVMSMINATQKDFINALKNLQQAEEYLGLDYEIMQEKAACLAQIGNYKEAVFTLNQMKLLHPGVYLPYSLTFSIYMQLGIYQEAENELNRALKFVSDELGMEYFNDRLKLTLWGDLNDIADEEKKRKLESALSIIQDGLEHGKPSAEQVVDAYIQAANIHLALKNPQMAVQCLEAAEDAVDKYNNGFSVAIRRKSESPSEYPSTSLEDLEANLLSFLKENNYSDDIIPSLSPINIIPKGEKALQYRLSEKYDFPDEKRDIVNSLFISAYEMLDDDGRFDKMLQKARALQASYNTASQYCGMYYELRVCKYKNEEKWKTKYQDRINYWTKQIIKNPTDYVSAAYRVRAYIDLGDRVKAEELFSCLPTDLRGELEEIMVLEADNEEYVQHSD